MPDREAFARKINGYLGSEGRNATWLAERLGVNRSTVARWCNGETLPSAKTVAEIAEVLHLAGDEKAELLQLAGYAYIDLGIYGEPAQDLAVQTENHESTQRLIKKPVSLREGWLHTLSQEYNRIIGDAEALPEKILRLALSPFAYLTAPRAVTIQLFVALWMIVDWLISPILAWPLPNLQLRFDASLRYAIASVVIPLAIVVVMRGIGRLFMKPSESKTLFLELTGALVGFLIFGAICIGFAISSYTFWGWTFGSTVRGLLSLIPLFFSYSAAVLVRNQRRRTPPKPEYEQLFRSTDRLMFGTALVSGPLIAFIIYAGYDVLTNRYTGFLLLLGLVVLILWEEQSKRKKQEHER